MIQAAEIYHTRHKVRIVTAASLFDGHDAAINVMRRVMQSSGAEVIHLGHNRSAREIVDAAVQEDAQAIAISSYQGGHMEYFKYMVDLLKERNAGHIKIFGGGGGVIVQREINELHAAGVTRIFSPEDGRKLGLQGMINLVMEQADFNTTPSVNGEMSHLDIRHKSTIARLITLAENSPEVYQTIAPEIRKRAAARTVPVVGITGTGGSGKSSLSDELVRRFLFSNPDRTIGILCVDPSKRKTGGALLGDRIRYNSIDNDRAYLRSLATRGSRSELSAATVDGIAILKAAGFDLILVETSGIGQGDAAITDVADVSIYVMTSEFGAQSQLEKIDMIDYADLIAVNKYERRGSADALRDVRKQMSRGRKLPQGSDLAALPVFGTVASRFNDNGVHAMYHELLRAVGRKCGVTFAAAVPDGDKISAATAAVIPGSRIDYLGRVADTVGGYKAWAAAQCEAASKLYQLQGAREQMEKSGAAAAALAALDRAMAGIHLDPRCKSLLEDWQMLCDRYRADTFTYQVRDKSIEVPLTTTSLSGLKIPKIALPRSEDWGDNLRFLLLENAPGEFPFTAGIYPFKRTEEDPKRMFAGEGPPERTNARFHFLSKNDPAKRLSTAFDSVTLYGEDPDTRPDIYGKIGESGVSICTLDDMKKLFAGFDLCHSLTSVSKTINGPAPIILAMFLNAAIDQQVDKFAAEHGRAPAPEEHAKLRAQALSVVRGTVQADILKEDQAQNTCIFSTEFALKMMGDVQEFFIHNKVRNYYSVSISGYHIAEAGANPISQLAFTLANGFTYVEYYLSRGFAIDDFAPNLSFFFSNGLDPEYTVIGRVARRIWALAIRDLYGGNDRSQKLKYHIQTSGRSLHAQEMQYNDIRTTLQALLALQDNCNSLHTNAYDEAYTTPTEESVRRAMAIQMIITREFGWSKNENPLQGSYLVNELTELVEEAVLTEFRRINERGGVLGAMETQYQRGRIQEESLLYEQLKHDGRMPIIGVNTYINPNSHADMPEPELRRATPEEKQRQLKNLKAFQTTHAAASAAALKRLQDVALKNGNIFAELMNTVRVASLGQITNALYAVGGKYRRNM